MSAFASRRAGSVASLGEERLIAAIARWLGPAALPSPAGIGDDCAVLPPARGRRLLTVDPVVYGRHFDRRTRPAAVGAKLLKRNLSDIAAMGGRPEAAVVSLLLDPRVSLAWLGAFHRGLAACARKHGVRIVGGDIAEARGVLAASLTLVGSAGPRILARRGARRGDAIYVTGVLGGSLASGHHHAFTPRLAEGSWLAGRPEVRAMMDVSDGLAKDLRALTPRGARAALEAAALPRRAGASLRAALGEGEDYELLFALEARADAAAFEAAWRRRFRRTRLTRIGRFVAPGRLPAGSLRLDDYHGFEHLR
ncbi:MAG TPA: thiamine-phosphate kinase [Opitutaceae bacterium]|nr:thiamine-phosphate kinase [Opitutaceae bacterium]